MKQIDRKLLEEFCAKHSIKRLSLYGSALSGGFLEGKSDYDILAEFEPENAPDLFEFSGMELELSEKLGVKVDLKTPGDLSKYFVDDVMRKAKPLYER